jgi:hypothetical protein
MPLPIQPNLIGGGDPNKALFSTSNDIMSQVTGASPMGGQPPLQPPLTPPAPPPQPAVEPQVAPPVASAPLATGVEPYTNKYDKIFEDAQSKLENLLSQKDTFNPMGLAMSRGFFRPTKTGSFSESLGNVAEEVGNAQGQMQKNDISNVQARMALAKAASENEREKESQNLMGQLYKEGKTGLEMDPKIAMRLASVLRDPKFLQQAQTEQKQRALQEAGSKVLESTTTTDENGKPKVGFTLNPMAFQEYARLTGDPLASAEKYAKTVGEMRRNGMLPQSPTAGTIFDPIMLMADSLGSVGPAIKLQAKRYAEEVKLGIMSPESADKMADHLLALATSTMKSNEALATTNAFRSMSLAMTAQNQEFMRQNQKERLDLLAQTAQDKKDEKQEKRDQALETQYQTMQSMKDKVNEVRSHEGRMSGLTSYNPLQHVAGTSQYGFMANVGVLKSQAFLSQVQQMRGLGALSNKEGAQVANALAAIDPGLSYAEQEKQFEYINKKMDQGMENIKRIQRGEKPVYGEPDSQNKGTTTTPNVSSPNVKLKPNANGSLDYHP